MPMSEPQSLERLAYGPDDAATVTGLGRTTIYEMLASGELRSVKVGRRRLIPASALRALVGEAGDDAS